MTGVIFSRNFGAGQFCRGMKRSPFVSVFCGRLRGMGGALRRCILPAPGGSGLDSFQGGSRMRRRQRRSSGAGWSSGVT
ncbi:MAG TPA: hypothetical protein DC058_11220 [Planctomycetaceae bacterium]|nr:hypothetical protein [Planctomycetaceae bacterium]HBC61775.1 hypothetical protein [Planctomycetaceae bacterium]